MSRLYGDLGATYGAHQSKTYGELFDADLPPTSGLVALFARVPRTDVYATPATTSIMATVAPCTIGWTLN